VEAQSLKKLQRNCQNYERVFAKVDSSMKLLKWTANLSHVEIIGSILKSKYCGDIRKQKVLYLIPLLQLSLHSQKACA
jgi:hypothetical protein